LEVALVPLPPSHEDRAAPPPSVPESAFPEEIAPPEAVPSSPVPGSLSGGGAPESSSFTTPEATTPEAEALPDGVPARVGRYVIEGALGRGGMGAVYRARDAGLHRSLAV
jgi:hypothetical protein